MAERMITVNVRMPARLRDDVHELVRRVNAASPPRDDGIVHTATSFFRAFIVRGHRAAVAELDAG